MSSLLTNFLDKPRSPAPLWARIATVGFLFFALSLSCWALLVSTTTNWEAVWKYRNAFWQGWLLTVLLSVVSLFEHTHRPARHCRASPRRYSSVLSIGYIECVRGMPLLVLILMFFYVVANALGIQDRLLVGVVVLSLFAGAYIAEIIEPELKAWRRNWKAHAPLGDCGTNVSIRHISRALRQILPPWQGSSLPSLRTLRFSQSLDSPNSLTQRSRLIQPPIAPWKATFPSPSAI